MLSNDNDKSQLIHNEQIDVDIYWNAAISYDKYNS